MLHTNNQYSRYSHWKQRLAFSAILLVSGIHTDIYSDSSIAYRAQRNTPIPSLAECQWERPSTSVSMHSQVGNRAVTATGPLSTLGNQIVAADGTKVRIQGVSWFGFESNNLAPHGLWTRNYKSMMDQIKSLGFNTLRIPFCNQMFDAGAAPTGVDQNANPELRGLNSIQILDKIVEYADQIGLWIMLDHHRSDAGVGALNNGLWYTDAYPESRFINDWVMLATRYRNNPSVVAFDLHNEPHGNARWGSNNAFDWPAAAKRAGDAVLAANPNLLILVEGVEQYNNQFYWWGGNLMGVRNVPVILSVPNKLVYSPHDYPNSIYSQPWFSAATFPNNLPGVFRNAWGYIFEQNIAPVVIGEFGSKFVDPKDGPWMDKITAYLNGDFNGTGTSSLQGDNQGISWVWWSWNPNSGDTGGVLMDDWQTPDQAKLTRLAPLLNGPQTGNGTGTGNNGGTNPPPATDPFINKIQVLYQDQSSAANDYQIKTAIKLVNTATQDVPYSELAIRYWFVKPADKQLQFWADWNKFGCPYIINGSFVPLFNPPSSANNYLELTFTANAGTLTAQTDSGAINVIIRTNDCTTFAQANDYSYNGNSNQFAENTKITLYHKGQLIWGTEPTPAGPVNNNGGCGVLYAVSSQWETGFTANVTLKNTTPSDIIGWTVEFTFPGNQQIVNIWNGVLTAQDNAITVKNADYNATIPANGSVSFGFQATYSGTNNNPTVFNFNGTQCTGSN